LKSGVLVHTFKGHSDKVNAPKFCPSPTVVVITPDSRFAVSGSDDHTLRVWDLKSGGLVHTMEGHTDSIAAVAISSDGHRAISGSADYTLRVWDLKSGKILCTLAGHTDPVTAVVVMPDQHH
jgi:WD40 repeat protein